MTSMYKIISAVFFIFIALISCESNQSEISKKSNPMIGSFSVAYVISDETADSLHCEGIQYVLQIKEDSTYIFKSTCYVVPKNQLGIDSGIWSFQDSLTLKLISVTTTKSYINFKKDYNFLTITIQKNGKIYDTFKLDRDTTLKN